MTSDASNKLRIAHILDSGGLYGAEMIVLNLVEEQIRQGFDSVIVSIGSDDSGVKPLDTEAQARGIPVHIVPLAGGFNPFAAIHLKRALQESRYDLVHSHGYKSNVLLGILPKRSLAFPVCATIHGYTSKTGVSRNALYEWLDRRMLHRLDAVVPVYEDVLEQSLIARLGSKVRVIHNGVAVSDRGLDQTLQNKLQIFLQGGFGIAGVGRLSAEKGFHDLIEALDILLNQGIDARLVLMGDGPEKSRLQALTQDKGLGDKVMMTGYVSNAAQYLSLAKVFAMPSYTEGLPVALLEAMHRRVPVVASRVGGIPEILEQGKGGLMTDSGAPEQLADSIKSIFEDPDQAQIRTEFSVVRVASVFTISAMERHYAQLYSELLTT